MLPKSKFKYPKLLAEPNDDKLTTKYKVPVSSAYKVRCGSFKGK